MKKQKIVHRVNLADFASGHHDTKDEERGDEGCDNTSDVRELPRRVWVFGFVLLVVPVVGEEGPPYHKRDKVGGGGERERAGSAGDGEGDFEEGKDESPVEEDEGRQRQVLAQILKQHVGELWSAGEFQKLMVLEYLFVVGGRNKDAAARFGIADEKAVAGIKFRAVERLRGMARQRDPNHSLFLGLWEPGSR